MAREIKSVLRRNSETILADALGAVSLLVILYVGLSVPNIF